MRVCLCCVCEGEREKEGQTESREGQEREIDSVCTGRCLSECEGLCVCVGLKSVQGQCLTTVSMNVKDFCEH